MNIQFHNLTTKNTKAKLNSAHAIMTIVPPHYLFTYSVDDVSCE